NLRLAGGMAAVFIALATNGKGYAGEPPCCGEPQADGFFSTFIRQAAGTRTAAACCAGGDPIVFLASALLTITAASPCPTSAGRRILPTTSGDHRRVVV